MGERRIVYLIDANAYVYRAFFGLPPLTGPDGTPTHAVYGFTTMLLKLLRDTSPEYVAAVFDAPGPTFRHEMFDAYKANRASMPDELRVQLPAVREVVRACRVAMLSVPGVEADDVIATLTAGLVSEDVDVVVVTSDKDLMQLVGDRVRLWDTMRDRWTDSAAVKVRFGVAPEQVMEILGLMGDSSDNIPGVRGIGEKTAQALIQRYGSIDALLSQLDDLAATKEVRGAKKLAASLGEQADIARLSRDLATVRRDVPFDWSLDDLRFGGLDTEALRPLFDQFGFDSLLRDVPASVAAPSVALRDGLSATEAEQLAADARASGGLGWATANHAEVDTADALIVGTTAIEPARLGRASDPDAWRIAMGVLHDPTVEKFSHDLKRDLLALPAGEAAAVVGSFDVMIASYVAEATNGHRLDELSVAMLGQPGEEYRHSDKSVAAGVSVLPRLGAALRQKIALRGQAQLFDEIEMPLVYILAAMERHGMLLDVQALTQIGTEMAVELGKLEGEIFELAGGSFNIGSPIQLREVLFEKLHLSTKGVKRGKTGLSTDVDVLSRLAAEHPLPGRVLEHRALAKLKSGFVDALPHSVRPSTGRLHTSFNQAVTATGRLSSSDPNLQNIPIRTDYGRRIRAAFVAAPGHLLIGADYSQIELRVLAHLSQDPALIRAFVDGTDVHAATAAEVFGVMAGTVTAEMRRAAKVINFGIIYGMGPQRLARELGISMSDAESYIKSYFERYAGVKAYMDGIREQAREHGYVATIAGRRRALPDLASGDRALIQAAERTATNTPIQGSAADLIKMAMVAIDRRFKREGMEAALILQVHDELLVEATEGEAPRALVVVREEMESVYPLRVPLLVEAGTGRHWAEIH